MINPTECEVCCSTPANSASTWIKWRDVNVLVAVHIHDVLDNQRKECLSEIVNSKIDDELDAALKVISKHLKLDAMKPSVSL